MVEDFSAAAEREWVCFVKAFGEVWPSVHHNVKLVAETLFKPLRNQVSLSKVTINKVHRHKLIQNFLQERPAVFPQEYAPKCFLREHYAFLLSNKQRVRSLVEAKLQHFMTQPRCAETVEPPLLSAHFMKSLNSVKSKVAREHLSPEDDEQVKLKVFLRDVFRLRV